MYCKTEVRMSRNHRGETTSTLGTNLGRERFNDTIMKRETWVSDYAQVTSRLHQGGKSIGHGGREARPRGNHRGFLCT
jgi:hypothetical protein